MGLPMLRALSAERPVTAFDRDPARRQAAAKSGGASVRIARSLAEILSPDIVLTMLPDGGIVRSVLLEPADGAGPLALRLAPGAVLVDMSSSDPADTTALAAELADRGVAVVDAPVSGSVAKAEAGTLSIMIGGDDTAVLKVYPLLAAMGSVLVRTGPLGSAHAMKALNNFVYAAGLLAVCEATLIAERLGLDLEVLTDILNSSSGRNVASETKLRQHILPGTYQGGFAIGLMAKDIGIARAMGEQAGVPAPALALCRELWQEALGKIPASADNLEIHRYLRAQVAGGSGADERAPGLPPTS